MQFVYTIVCVSLYAMSVFVPYVDICILCISSCICMQLYVCIYLYKYACRVQNRSCVSMQGTSRLKASVCLSVCQPLFIRLFLSPLSLPFPPICLSIHLSISLILHHFKLNVFPSVSTKFSSTLPPCVCSLCLLVCLCTTSTVHFLCNG